MIFLKPQASVFLVFLVEFLKPIVYKLAMTGQALTQIQTLAFELEAFESELKVIQEKMNRFGESSALAIQKYFDEHLPLWQRKIEEMKITFGKLPDDFKKSEFSLSVSKKFDHLSLQLVVFRQKIQTSDFSQWSSKVIFAIPDLNKLRISTSNLCDSIKNFQLDPFIQKVLASGRELASKKDLQWSRKLFHTANGLIGFYFWGYSGLADWIILSVLGIYFLYALTTEIIRRKYPAYNRWMIKTIGWMMREHEKTTISSATYYISTMFFVMLVFPKEVSLLTLFYVAVGDTFAGIVGVLWGRHKITQKVSFEGAFACFAVCALATYLIITTGLPGFTLTGHNAILFSISGGLIAALAEGSFKKYDDNLVMPLISAPLLTLLIWLFQ